MERKSDKKNILIGALVVVILVMSVGFALFSNSLDVTSTGTVSGNWSVKFQPNSFTEVSKSAGATVNTHVIDANQLQATFDVSLLQPGDFAEYNLIVENTGSIDALLRSAVVTPTSAENTDAIKFSYTVLNGSDVITAGDMTGAGTQNIVTAVSDTYKTLAKTTGTHTVKIKIEYLTSVNAEENDTASYKLTLNYEQAA